ncbi:MAG TPA: 2OG-Fe(II) oxygenase, partial [Gammaproteobacteria bacterium]|nr:2OG-Fe(II) oxygenase [Gammaproteobacteria bacterium]
ERTQRDTFQFGYDYFSMAKDDFSMVPIPSYLRDLCQACISAFGKQYELGAAEDYENVMVSRYRPGYQLEPHMDVDVSDQFTDGKKVNFYFGETVLGVVLQPDLDGKLFVIDAEIHDKLSSPVFFLNEQMGTAYLLNGKYRRHPYLHGVSKVRDHRISVTFRTVMVT